MVRIITTLIIVIIETRVSHARCVWSKSELARQTCVLQHAMLLWLRLIGHVKSPQRQRIGSQPRLCLSVVEAQGRSALTYQAPTSVVVRCCCWNGHCQVAVTTAPSACVSQQHCSPCGIAEDCTTSFSRRQDVCACWAGLLGYTPQDKYVIGSRCTIVMAVTAT